MYLYECKKCGQPAASRAGRAEQCSSCRLHATIMYADPQGSRRRRCKSCSAKYSPSLNTDTLCGSCEAILRGECPKGDCGICGEKAASLYYPDVAVCFSCLRDPQSREKIKGILARSIGRRKERYRDTEEQHRRVIELWDQMGELEAAWELVSAGDSVLRGRKARLKAEEEAITL